jgi:16S rRNA (guanine(966)-N(2))-methyltransferase RsmD
MRVIGGEFRGRRLRSPGGTSTRPTSDRVREALFSILAARVGGSLALDAYAGTGAVGIEALSRGARRCVFVESSAGAVRVLRANLAALGLQARSRVLASPFARAATRLGAEEGPFDLVFLDPPYGPGELLRALRIASASGLVAPDGIVVAEHDAGLALPAAEGILRRRRTARYGGTCLSLFHPEPGPRAPAGGAAGVPVDSGGAGS